MRAALHLRRTELPPCDGCGEWDAGSHGFGPQTHGKEMHFCGDCTPSRSGVAGLRAVAAPALPIPRASAGQADLFGSRA